MKIECEVFKVSRFARYLSLFILAFLFFWPMFKGMVACTDDISMLIPNASGYSISKAFELEWGSYFFRPLYVISGYLVDPVSRGARAVLFLHLFAGVLISASIIVVSEFLGFEREYCWLSVLIWSLQSSSAVGFWQSDTVSQTWCAALGIWMLICLVWVSKVGLNLFRLFLILVLAIFGFLSKESFVGWSVVCFLGLFFLRKRYFSSFLISSVILAVNVTYLSLRLFRTHLSDSIHNPGLGRYSFHGSIDMVRSFLTGFIGLLFQGPVHDLAPGVSSIFFGKALVVVGTVSFVSVGLLRYWFLLKRKKPFDKTIDFIFLFALCLLFPYLPMGHMSELYLFGSSIFVSLWFVGSLRYLILSGFKYIGVVLVAVVFLAGSLGLLSRAKHFEITWEYSRALESMAYSDRLAIVRDGKLSISEDCMSGANYSVYLVSPAVALNCGETVRVLEALSRSSGLHGEARPEPTFQIGCGSLPARWSW